MKNYGFPPTSWLALVLCLLSINAFAGPARALVRKNIPPLRWINTLSIVEGEAFPQINAGLYISEAAVMILFEGDRVVGYAWDSRQPVTFETRTTLWFQPLPKSQKKSVQIVKFEEVPYVLVFLDDGFFAAFNILGHDLTTEFLEVYRRLYQEGEQSLFIPELTRVIPIPKDPCQDLLAGSTAFEEQ